jgi:heat-inducible transcriptional repressor
MEDVAESKNLTGRQEALLYDLVKQYTNIPEPVSSKALAGVSELGLSSATIRNEMAVLEELGYIRSPHTSSGRVPTEEGYRYFVKLMLDTSTLPEHEAETLRQRFDNAPLELESRLRTATMILAQQNQAAALVTEPRPKKAHRFKHIQVISTQGRMVLMILVLEGGHVHQQMLVLAESVSQDMLNQASEMLNRACTGQTVDAMLDRIHTLPLLLAREIGEIAADAIQQMNELGSRILYRTSLSAVLPEFTEEKGAQQVIRVLEGQTELDEILMRFDENNTVQVVVAGEGHWEEFSHLSMVLGRFGTAHIMGAIGVVGPTRMRYGQAISTVHYVARLMSDFLSEIHEVDHDLLNAPGDD